MEARSSFSAPHNESKQQVVIDEDHHQTTHELRCRINPKVAAVDLLAIASVTAVLDRVLGYIHSVLVDGVQGDPAVGRYLLDTLAASTGDRGFNASLRVN